ncbi:hypothetical protein SRHO_G00248100 [Serrasalmus rhombeus]
MWLELNPEDDVSELGEAGASRAESFQPQRWSEERALDAASGEGDCEEPCEERQCGVSLDLFLHVSLLPSMCIVAALSFLHHREKTQPFEERFPYLRGRFGFVVPLDFIGSMSNRWSYGVAFGAVTPSVLQLFSESYTPFPVPNWAKGGRREARSGSPVQICTNTTETTN